MIPISPNTGAEEVMVAEDQLEYMPLAGALYREEGTGTLVILFRYQPSPSEREAIAHGEDVYIRMLGHVVPHNVYVGKPDWA